MATQEILLLLSRATTTLYFVCTDGTRDVVWVGQLLLDLVESFSFIHYAQDMSAFGELPSCVTREQVNICTFPFINTLSKRRSGANNCTSTKLNLSLSFYVKPVRL